MTRLAIALFSGASALLATEAISRTSAGTAPPKVVVQTLNEAAPDSISPAIRKALRDSAIRITVDGKTLYDIWLRAELPLVAGFEATLDVQYPIEPWSVVGTLRVAEPNVADFRKQAIKPGVYVIRYGLQPQDGNHLGTAQYRDFFMIALAADDKDLAAAKPDDAYEWSKKAAGANHPIILSLLPPQKGRKEIPGIVRDEDMEFDILVVNAAGKVNGKAAAVQIELVVVGHSDE